MFKLQDGDYFRRWQRGMKIVVSDSSVTKVYFTTKAMDSAIEVDVVDGVANVPNPLLRQAYDITVYCYVDGKVKMKVFGIKDREKPADYECWRELKDPRPKYVTREEYVEEMQDIPNFESGGGIGGSSTGGGVFTVNFTKNEDGSYSADKTHEEIKYAFNNNMVVRGYYTEYVLVPMIVGTNVAPHVFYSLLVDNGGATFSTYLIDVDNSIIVVNQLATLSPLS